MEMNIGEEALQQMEESDLIKHIRSNDLDGPDTALAAEILGQKAKSSTAIAVLALILCTHPSAIAREGAAYGLSWHVHREDVSKILRDQLQRETSASVRDIIKGALGVI